MIQLAQMNREGNKMTTLVEPLSPDLELPWTPNPEQEALFKRWTQRTLILVLLFYVIVPWLPVFEPEYVEPERQIVRTKVVLEAVKPPPVKPVRIEPKPEPVAKVKPKPEKPKVAKQSAKKSSAPKVKPKTTKASLSRSKSLSSLSSLTALRGKLNVAGLKKKTSLTSSKGLVATVDRDVLGENRATKASLGVKVDEGIMKRTASSLAGHQTSSVEGVIVEGGNEVGDDSNYNYVSGLRDSESIKMEVERRKGSIYSLYYEAMNNNPELHGLFVFKMVIEPDGRISKLDLVSSELGFKELEAKMLERIQSINFGQADVATTTVQYRFRFVPS